MSSTNTSTNIEFPSGALALSSPVYVERPPLESLCRQNIEIPGSLTRIKGPRHTGKSSLLIRLLDHAKRLNYQSVSVNFQSAESATFSDLSLFLRWFCGAVARQLNLSPDLDTYWDEETGAKLSATIYFEDYLLEQVPGPIVIALNEVNRIFEHPDIARDFLPLLRYWFEQGKHSDSDGEGFQKLRMIVVHSTDIYIPLNVHQSPFNVGLPVQMKGFTSPQIKQLATQYGLSLNAAAINALIQLVGGHPYLVSIACYHLASGTQTLDELIHSAATTSGIYSHHLKTTLGILQAQPEVFDSLNMVVESAGPVQINPAHAHQLVSLGLVTMEGSLCQCSCALYQQFFAQRGLLKSPHELRFQALQEENEQLKQLVSLDGLTKVGNRRHFDQQLSAAWNRAAIAQKSIALVMIDIDYFKLYNDTYGHIAGDVCLQKVAQALAEQVRSSTDTVARYGGEEFAILLTQTDSLSATQFARRIRKHVLALGLEHSGSKLPEKVVSLSIGVACVTPQSDRPCSTLVAEADAALYRSKQLGRNRVTVNQPSIHTSSNSSALGTHAKASYGCGSLERLDSERFDYSPIGVHFQSQKAI